MKLQDISKDTLKGSMLHLIVADLREKEDALAFEAAAYNPAAGLLEVEVTVEVQDADGDKVSVSDSDVPAKPGIEEVTVDITGGTATVKRLKGSGPEGAEDASLVVKLRNGKGTFTVLADTTGTVLLGLTDSQVTGLNAADTATVTFS